MSNTTALQPFSSDLSIANPRKVSVPGPKDWKRWKLRHLANLTEEEIAARESISIVKVKDSLLRVADWQFERSSPAVDSKLNEMILSRIPNVGEAIDEALRAMRIAADGVTEEVDHSIRLKAIDTLKSLSELTRPKGGGPTINVNQQNQQLNIVGGQSRSFEERLRSIREKNHLKNEEAVIDVEPEGDDEADVDDYGLAPSESESESEEEVVLEGEVVDGEVVNESSP